MQSVAGCWKGVVVERGHVDAATTRCPNIFFLSHSLARRWVTPSHTLLLLPCSSSRTQTWTLFPIKPAAASQCPMLPTPVARRPSPVAQTPCFKVARFRVPDCRHTDHTNRHSVVSDWLFRRLAIECPKASIVISQSSISFLDTSGTG